MNTETANTIMSIEKSPQYDASAKRVLGDKIIISHILVRTIDEFRGMSPSEVEALIEGEPIISGMSIEPGLTNNGGQRIVGSNTEYSDENEGTIRFDIIFYVRTKDGSSQVIINIEAQRKEPENYDILNRAIFYVSRLISSQKERDFSNSEYNKIKKVYSIWVCMDAGESSLNHIRLTDYKLLGNHEWRGKLDLLNIIFIGLTREIPEQDENYELHRLLTILLSEEISKKEKLSMMEDEYNIPSTSSVSKEVSVMCNLSEGIYERAMEKGIEKGIETGIVKGKAEGISIQSRKMAEKLLALGIMSNAEIANIAELSIEEVNQLSESRKSSQRSNYPPM